MSERSAEKRPPLDSVYGTLPDWVLRRYIKERVIKIDPLQKGWKEKLGPVTIDFHLGGKILIPLVEAHSYIDVKREVKEEMYQTILLGEGDPHILKPGQFMVTQTREWLELPNDIVGRLEGKSSLARIGIVIHLTAGRFDPGWSGVPVLELKNNSDTDVILYEGWPICAFSFEKLMAVVEKPFSEQDRYADGTIHSQIHDTQKR